MKSLEEYFEKDLRWGRGYQQTIVFNFLKDCAAAAGEGVVLDAGAGHQRYKPFFAGNIYLAQEHPEAGATNKGIQSYDILSDVRKIPLVADCVDCVLSTSSLEHMEFPQEFFHEAFRVLKPGGSLFINVPFAFPEHEVPYDFQRPTRYGLLRWYRHAGFENVSVRASSSSIFTTTAFLKTAILEDNGNFRATLRKSMVEAMGVAFRKNLFGKALVYYLIAKPLAAILMFFLDKAPAEHTIFPVGWVARASKPGEHQVGMTHSTKLEFLEANMLGEGFELVEGVIRARD